MKKSATIALLILLLAGCQPIGPDAPAMQDSVQSLPSPSPLQPTPAGTQDSKGVIDTIPLPESLPEKTGDAAQLPEESIFSVAKNGYGGELLTPAQYNARIVVDKRAPRGFLESDFFWLAQDGLCALVNPEGKIVTDFIYEDPESDWRYVQEKSRAALVRGDGKYGLLDAADGSVLLPMEYDKIWGEKGYVLAQKEQNGDIFVFGSDFNKRYTMARGDTLLIARETDVLLQSGVLRFFDHETGAPVDNFACARAVVLTGSKPDDEFVRLGVTIGDKVGVCDGEGQWIASPAYTNIGAFRGDYATIEQDGKFGAIDYDGRVTVRPVWDDLVLFDNGASICKDGKWGTISDLSNGKAALQPFYDYIDRFDSNGRACFEKKGRYGLLDRDGNVLVPAKYNHPITTEELNLDAGYFAVQGVDGAHTMGIVGPGGIYSLSADHAFFPRGLNDYYSGDEPYNLVRTPAGRWGYVDGTGKFVIDARFDEADAFIEGWDAAFVKEDGKVSLVSRDGTIVLRTVFDDVIAFDVKTKVCAMSYMGDSGEEKVCLVKLITP